MSVTLMDVTDDVIISLASTYLDMKSILNLSMVSESLHSILISQEMMKLLIQRNRILEFILLLEKLYPTLNKIKRDQYNEKKNKVEKEISLHLLEASKKEDWTCVYGIIIHIGLPVTHKNLHIIDEIFMRATRSGYYHLFSSVMNMNRISIYYGREMAKNLDIKDIKPFIPLFFELDHDYKNFQNYQIIEGLLESGREEKISIAVDLVPKLCEIQPGFLKFLRYLFIKYRLERKISWEELEENQVYSVYDEIFWKNFILVHIHQKRLGQRVITNYVPSSIRSTYLEPYIHMIMEETNYTQEQRQRIYKLRYPEVNRIYYSYVHVPGNLIYEPHNDLDNYVMINSYLMAGRADRLEEIFDKIRQSMVVPYDAKTLRMRKRISSIVTIISPNVQCSILVMKFMDNLENIFLWFKYNVVWSYYNREDSELLLRTLEKECENRGEALNLGIKVTLVYIFNYIHFIERKKMENLYEEQCYDDLRFLSFIRDHQDDTRIFIMDFDFDLKDDHQFDSIVKLLESIHPYAFEILLDILPEEYIRKSFEFIHSEEKIKLMLDKLSLLSSP